MPKDTLHEELLHAQAWMKSVQDMATSKGGMVTCRFSQSIEPVQSFIKLHKDSAGGICQGLCNNWIVSHANNGSIWNDVYVEVGNKVKFQAIRIDKMAQLCMEFIVQLQDKKGKKGDGNTQALNSRAGHENARRHPTREDGGGGAMEGWGTCQAHSGRSAGANTGIAIWHGMKPMTAFGSGEGAYVQITIWHGNRRPRDLRLSGRRPEGDRVRRSRVLRSELRRVLFQRRPGRPELLQVLHLADGVLLQGRTTTSSACGYGRGID